MAHNHHNQNLQQLYPSVKTIQLFSDMLVYLNDLASLIA